MSAAAAAGGGPRPRHHQGRRRPSPRSPATPRDPGARMLGVGVERTAGIRRGVVRDIEETTRAIDQGDEGRAADGRRRGRHGLLRRRRRARGRAHLARHGLGHRRRDPHQRRRPGERHGQQRLVRPGPRAAARHSAGLPGRPAGRHHRADRHDRLPARGRGVPGHGAVERRCTNLRKCVERAGFQVGEFVLEPLAASLAVLTPRRDGSSAAPSSSWAAGRPTWRSSSNGKIRHTASLLCAGGHVTTTSSTACRSPRRTPSGSRSASAPAFEPLVPESDIIELPGTPGQGARTAQRRVLAHIMHMRLQEILEYALDEITRAGYHQRLPAGIILTGGGALTPGHRRAGPRSLRDAGAGAGCRGRACAVWRTASRSPRMAVTAGLLLYGARQVTMSGGFGTGCAGSRRRSRKCSPRSNGGSRTSSEAGRGDRP